LEIEAATREDWLSGNSFIRSSRSDDALIDTRNEASALRGLVRFRGFVFHLCDE
jgi:hypothetical protein